MTTTDDTADDPLTLVRQINAQAAFNRWCGIEVTRAEPRPVDIAVPWRAEFGQYAGFLVSAGGDGRCPTPPSPPGVAGVRVRG